MLCVGGSVNRMGLSYSQATWHGHLPAEKYTGAAAMIQPMLSVLPM